MSTGLADLLARFGDARPELALLLVKAPLGRVVSGLADAYGMAPLVQEAPVRPAEEAALAGNGWMAAVQQRDDAWSCVYVALGEVVGLDRDLVRQTAADFSDTLTTEAIALAIFPSDADEESAGGLRRVSFEAFTEGEISDRICWRVDGPVEVFESARRELPGESETIGLELAGRLLADRGIHVAACSPRNRGEQAWLALWDLDPARIDRADLFRLRGSSFFEDETLEMTLEEVEDAKSEAPAAEAGEPAADDGAEAPAEEPAAEKAPKQPAGGLRGILNRLVGRRD